MCTTSGQYQAGTSGGLAADAAARAVGAHLAVVDSANPTGARAARDAFGHLPNGQVPAGRYVELVRADTLRRRL